MISIVKDTFYIETLNGYQKKTFPRQYFHPSIRKRRIKCLLDHIVFEVEHNSVQNVYNVLTWSWIEKYKLDKLLQFVENYRQESMNENARSIFRIAYPELPQSDFAVRAIELFYEVQEGTRKVFPDNFFAFSLGDERKRIIYKHVFDREVQISNIPVNIPLSKERLIEYKLNQLIKDVDELHAKIYG